MKLMRDFTGRKETIYAMSSSVRIPAMASWIEGMLMLFNLNPGSLNSKEKKGK
jgi:hypothetical protein